MKKKQNASLTQYLDAFSHFSTLKVSGLFSGIRSNYILETELASPEPTVDISICILKKEINYLLKHWRKKGFRTVIQGDEAWEKMFRFCSVWEIPGAPLYSNISDVWFEFDNFQLEKDLLLPGACFFFSPINLYKRQKRGSYDWDNRRIKDTGWLFNIALYFLCEGYLPGKTKRNVETCIEALPGNGAVFQIGVMFPRDYDGLRICTSMPVDDTIAYLEKIGWKGSREYLDKILQTIKSHVNAVFIDIDVGEKFFTKIGIECCFKNDGNILLRVKKILDYLIGQHLCLKEKAESILSWIDNSDELPGNLSKETGIIRTLSHLKIVLNPDNSLKAKAYLALSVISKRKRETG